MKKIFTIIILFVFLYFVSIPTPISFGSNLNSIDIELSDNPLKYLTAADSTDLSITGDFTTYGLVKLESFTGTYATIFSKGDRTTPQITMWFEISGAKQPAIWYYANELGTLYTYAYTTTAWDDTYLNVWHFIAISCDVSVPDCIIYVDGSSVATTMQFTGATSVRDNAGVFNIGATPDSGEYGGSFDGLIDEVALFSDIRTSGEISADWTTFSTGGHLNGNEGNIVVNYMFDGSSLEDKGATTDPAGAIADDLTNNNSVVFSTDVIFSGGGANNDWEFYEVD